MFMEKKKSLSALLALLLLLCFTSIALAAPRSAQPETEEMDIADIRVLDEAELLSASEEKTLDSTLASIEKARKVRILIGTTNDVSGKALGQLANQIVDEIPAENGTIVFLLAPSSRDWYISTDNKARLRITDDKGLEYLSGQFLPELKENRYAAAFGTFAKVTDEMLTYYEKEGEAYDASKEFSLMALGIAFVCALILGGVIYYALIEQMSNVTSATQADTYLDHDTFELTHSEDHFLYTTVSRTPKEKKEDSSSNVTSSSSDSSHGGGGGKY